MRTAAVVVVVAVASIFGGCRTAPSSAPREVLERRIGALHEAPRFRFAYASGGTRVNDCFLPNRSFVGEVDQDEGLLVVRSALEREPIAAVVDGRTYLHASLFREGSVPTAWVAAPLAGDPPLRAAMTRVLGVGLASYLRDGSLPPGPVAVLRESFAVAKNVARRPAGARGERYVLRLDSARFPGAGAPSEKPFGDPTLEAWLDGGAVRRITVTPGAPPGAPADAESLAVDSWSIDFFPLAASIDPPDVGPVTELGSLDPVSLGPATIENCDLPLTTEPP